MGPSPQVEKLANPTKSNMSQSPDWSELYGGPESLDSEALIVIAGKQRQPPHISIMFVILCETGLYFYCLRVSCETRYCTSRESGYGRVLMFVTMSDLYPVVNIPDGKARILNQDH